MMTTTTTTTRYDNDTHYLKPDRVWFIFVQLQQTNQMKMVLSLFGRYFCYVKMLMMMMILCCWFTHIIVSPLALSFSLPHTYIPPLGHPCSSIYTFNHSFSFLFFSLRYKFFILSLLLTLSPSISLSLSLFHFPTNSLTRSYSFYRIACEPKWNFFGSKHDHEKEQIRTKTEMRRDREREIRRKRGRVRHIISIMELQQ